VLVLIVEDFSLSHFNGLHIRCTFRLPDRPSVCRLTVVAPGFLGFKDWGFFPYLSERLCHSGFGVLSFSHSHCGVQENPLEISDTDSFFRNSTTQELKDWDLLLDAILEGRFPHSKRVRLSGFGVVGHSRGGSFGILKASQVRQIQSVVAWGAIQTFQRYDASTLRRWRESGALECGESASGRLLKLGIGALEALERNQEHLDVLRAIRSVSVPVMLLHGRQDKRVSCEESRRIWQSANPHLSRFHIIESAGHTFRTQHPFTIPSQPLLEAVAETIRWFEATLR